jgi:hypothetical protein
MGQTGWDASDKTAEEASSGGSFLKLEHDKDKALLVWCGDPYSKLVFWDGEGYLEADSEEGKAYADNHPNKKPGFRASMNAFVLDEQNGDAEFVMDNKSQWRMAMFENGVNWYKDLKKSKKKYGLGIKLFELQRHGKAKDPKTKYSILPDADIDSIPGLKEAIAKATLHDLANPLAGDDDSKGDDSKKSKSKSNGVISDEEKASLVKELKTLPRTDLPLFKEAFSIKFVKDLGSAKLDEAITWIANRKSPAAEKAEQDPFE